MAANDETLSRSAPLTETDLADINRALERLQDAETLIQRAAQARIDVTAFQSRAREAKDRLLAIKQAFFPGQ